MKKILIIIVLGALGYFGWQAIQTKPDADVPKAVVEIPTTETQKTSDTPKEIPYGDDVNPGNKTNNSLVSVSFKGFGPGKVHNGSFSNVKSNLYLGDSGDIWGNITIDMNSFTTDNDKLTAHLKSKDFFDVTVYPKSVFTAKELIGMDAQGAQISGDITIKGITKKVSFPVKFKTHTAGPTELLAYSKSWESTFTLNMKDFGIDQKFANETVELSVVVPTLK
jgi:polyisoprenoid-binding protein YceI